MEQTCAHTHTSLEYILIGRWINSTHSFTFHTKSNPQQNLNQPSLRSLCATWQPTTQQGSQYIWTLFTSQLPTADGTNSFLLIKRINKYRLRRRVYPASRRLSMLSDRTLQMSSNVTDEETRVWVWVEVCHPKTTQGSFETQYYINLLNWIPGISSGRANTNLRWSYSTPKHCSRNPLAYTLVILVTPWQWTEHISNKIVRLAFVYSSLSY